MATPIISTQPDYIRIDPGSIKSLDDVGQNVVGPVNRFNEQVAVSLNGALVFGANITIPVYTQTFTTPAGYGPGSAAFTTFQFAGPYSGISAVMIGNIVLASNTSGVITNLIGPPQWQEIRAGQVQITYIAGLTANTKYNITFFVV